MLSLHLPSPISSSLRPPPRAPHCPEGPRARSVFSPSAGHQPPSPAPARAGSHGRHRLARPGLSPTPPRCRLRRPVPRSPSGRRSPGRGRQHAQPSAPTPIYPSRWAPGASMFLGDRKRRRNRGGGGGMRAASREPALQSRRRRVRRARPPPAAAPRHAAPHLAASELELKGPAGARAGEARRPPPPPGCPLSGGPGPRPPPREESTPSLGRAQLTNQNLVEG